MRAVLRWCILAAGVAAAGLGPAVAAAGVTDLRYDIRKEGEPIGQETVRITGDPANAVVEVQTHSRAAVLFLEFRYDHTRREEWRDGRLERVVADTDDDGTKSHLDAVRGGAGWTLTINERAERRGSAALPLTLWGRAVLDRDELFSVIDAKPYRVQVVPLGGETLILGGQPVGAEHFRITGDVERDLWYGADGYLLRATFRRAGYVIELVRASDRP